MISIISCLFRSKIPRTSVMTGVVIAAILCPGATAFAQEANETDSEKPEKQAVRKADISISDFRPQSTLKNIRMTDLQSARFPAIDIHTHFGFRIRGDDEKLADFVETMNRQNIAVCTSLDARLGATLQEHTAFLKKNYADRFAIFVHIDFQGDGKPDEPATWDCHREDFGRRVARMLEDAKGQGACGVKFFKQFGLGYRNADGSLIKIDDLRWNPIWEACGRLGLPVIIHTGDPAAFFQPIDKFNERYEELSRHPDWSFHGDEFPSRDELLAARNRVIAAHPKTTFIGAHMAGNSEDLKQVGEWLDQYPNLVVEPASRIGELGRQPFTARDFLIKYQDRVLFGTDGPWPEQRLTYYWRFFETHDEYFPYSEKQPPPQGLWHIYGVKLPDEVLRKIYYENALRVIPGLAESYTRALPSLRNATSKSK